MTYAEEFAARLQALIVALSAALNTDESTALRRLVDNNEGAEALITLAEVIVQRNARISEAQLSEIRALAEGVVSPGDLPAGLDLQVVT